MSRHAYLILAIALGSAPVRAQNQDTVFVGPHIDKLIGEGRYKDAQEFIRTGIDTNAVKKTYSATYYAGAGKFFMEIGNFKDAAQALSAAESISSSMGIGVAITARERAANLLAQGDYAAAASMAVKATRESSYEKVRDIVLAYCRSLEALARLRSGDLKRAEKLIRDALKDVPKDNDSEPLFAPRTLFAGCLIESHLAHYQEAQELCRRGFEVLEKKKIDSRDISLGHLAQAESYFLSGDPARSRELIERSMEHTAKMFQPQHQDTAGALELLARVDLKEGKAADALTHAKAAVDTAAAVFGEGAGGTRAAIKTLMEASKANVK